MKEYELVASCPKCKTFETLDFNGQKLMPTKKFEQRDSKVYHDCGSDKPCNLFPGFIEKRRGLVLN